MQKDKKTYFLQYLLIMSAAQCFTCSWGPLHLFVWSVAWLFKGPLCADRQFWYYSEMFKMHLKQLASGGLHPTPCLFALAQLIQNIYVPNIFVTVANFYTKYSEEPSFTPTRRAPTSVCAQGPPTVLNAALLLNCAEPLQETASL